jgi:hypothetical protein
LRTTLLQRVVSSSTCTLYIKSNLHHITSLIQSTGHKLFRHGAFQALTVDNSTSAVKFEQNKAVKDNADVFEWFAMIRTVGHRKKPDTSGHRCKRRKKGKEKMQPTI